MDNAMALNYTGAWHDPVIGGLPLGNGYRTYLPELMRFNAPDYLSPFEEGGINPYAYCSGDPINFSDPSGQFQISWMGGLGIVVALLGIGLAIFTGGSSLAIAGAALGAGSATTGIAADNTEGTTHDVLMGLSIVSGVAGGITDVAGIATSIAKNIDSALQLAGGIGRDVRTQAAASEAVVRYSARAQTVEIHGAAATRAGQDGAQDMHDISGMSQADADISEGSSASTRAQEISAESSNTAARRDSLQPGEERGPGWMSHPLEEKQDHTRFIVNIGKNMITHLDMPNAYSETFRKTFLSQQPIEIKMERYREIKKAKDIPMEVKEIFKDFKNAQKYAHLQRNIKDIPFP